MRLGIADHLGWAVAVVADGREVVERRRIALVEEGLPAAPVHHVGGPWEEHRDGPPLDDAALAALVARVRESARRTTAAELDALPPVTSISLRAWPPDFPREVATIRRVPYESRADAVMYRQVLAELAAGRGWAVHLYEARAVATLAATLDGPGGPPWTKDHRTALAATLY
jgi:hypothetical protein